MAAKPPKPPGHFLKHSAANTTSNNTTNVINNNNSNSTNESKSENTTISECVNANDNCNSSSTPAKSKPNCNCTNITIMHLFHEMKQEFPTIPDTIVTQCVNENCHQRDNCVQMLRNELELNPIPVQSYPAKVLHPPNNNNNHYHHHHHHQHHHTAAAASAPATTLPAHTPAKPPLQQKPLVVQQKPPLKPAPQKSVRPAPPQPSNPSSTTTTTINNVQPNSPLLQKKITSTGVGLIHSPVRHASKVLSGDVPDVVEYSEGGDINEKLNDMSAKTTSSIQQTPIQANSPHVVEVNNNNNSSSSSENNTSVGETTTERSNLPRARPTTLNLNTQQHQQQQQQRQRLNVQLQEHFLQQRNKQQAPPPPPPPANASVSPTKPLRKAPLPPIAPKPILFHHSNTANNNNGDTLSSHTTSPLSESEISVNVSLSTPSPTSSSTTSKTHHITQHLQNKSPIRHRSVITLQPEPPYTRDFFQATSATPATLTPTTTANSSVVSSPTNSAYSGSSQKSYTSVNLTLRPPTTVLNSALQPSTIDITAGPGFSGASGGGKSLSYSSTSYDARLGYQQNFHITVTDEGGVFSASRRRPQRNTNQVNICENQCDGNSDGDKNNHVNSLYAEQQQHLNQQQQQQYLQQHQQFHNNTANVVAVLQQQQQHPNNPNILYSPKGIGGGGGGGFGNMCLAPQPAEDEYVTGTLERQKKRRDKLAAALRENKKRLSQVEQEVNLITGPIPAGLPERLDIEIQKLRSECQAMLRSSNPLTQQPRPQQQQQQQPQQQQQFPPQPFPRQRSSRPPPPLPPPRQTSLDIIQHHATPHTPASLPNFINTPSPTMVAQQQQQLQHSHSLSPSIYQQQQQQESPQSLAYQQHHNHPTNVTCATTLPDDEPYYSDADPEPDYDEEEDDEYEVVEPWECSMCTFRNHPQLNICECCENVRILPEPVLSREDIHITLSPGENRIIHSWIVS